MVGVALILGCLLAGLAFSQQPLGFLAPEPGPMTGRYELRVIEDSPRPNLVYVLDTKTGNCWWRYHEQNKGWNSLGSPVAPKAEKD